MGTTETTIRPTDINRSARWYARNVRWYALEKAMNFPLGTQSSIRKRTQLDRKFLSKLVDPGGRPSLSPKTLAKLSAGLGFNADDALHLPHRAETDERLRAKLDQYARSLQKHPD